MSELKVKASGEYVIIEATARPQGSEIKSESGIVVGVRQHGEQPFYGKVVSVGVDVPAEAAERILVNISHCQALTWRMFLTLIWLRVTFPKKKQKRRKQNTFPHITKQSRQSTRSKNG